LVLRVWVLKPRPVGGVLYYSTGQALSRWREREELLIPIV